jgi:hypothetical protein
MAMSGYPALAAISLKSHEVIAIRNNFSSQLKSHLRF